MSIRKMTLADEEVYRALFDRGVREHSRQFRVSPADVVAMPTPLALPHSDDFTLGAFSEMGSLLGVVSFEREKREKMRHKGLLYRMYVSAEAAGKGIGRALVRETIRLARAQSGLEQINLTVIADNTRAKILYETENFVTFSREKNALKVGGNEQMIYLDEEQMALRF